MFPPSATRSICSQAGQADAIDPILPIDSLENDYYRVELDPASGAVRSIYDKQLQRELVNTQSPYRFAQYLYVSGGDEQPNTLLQFPMAAPKAELKIDQAHDGRLISVDRTPDGWLRTYGKHKYEHSYDRHADPAFRP